MDNTIELALPSNIKPQERVLRRHGSTTSFVPLAYTPYRAILSIWKKNLLIKIEFDYEYYEEPKITRQFEKQPNSYSLVQGKYSGKLLTIWIRFSDKESLKYSFESILQQLGNIADVASKEHTKWNFNFAQRFLPAKIWPLIEEENFNE